MFLRCNLFIEFLRVQGHEVLLRFPPQPKDREMAEEEEANPQLEEDEEESDDDGEESVPGAESGEEVENDDEEEEDPPAWKRRRGAQPDEGASSAVPTGESSGEQRLEVAPLHTAPPAAKKKKYAFSWCDWPEGNE